MAERAAGRGAGTLRINLQVNVVLMYQLEKLFVALKKFWMGNMTIFLKMPSVVLVLSKMSLLKLKKWDFKR